MNVANDLYCQALDLPADKRGELALILLESLPEDDPPIQLDPESEAEIRRRIAASERGESKMFSLDQVMAMLRERRDAQSPLG
jgi:putative addiction module component (TIGR02574 family)